MEFIEKNNKKTLGNLGENIAADYLKKNGYVILERNFKFSRFGEIDIIAKHNEYICFVEVKTRTGSNFGVPSEAVDKRKQAKIRRLAQIYIKGKGLIEYDIRFDVIEILVAYKEYGKQEYEIKDINLIENAFC